MDILSPAFALSAFLMGSAGMTPPQFDGLDVSQVGPEIVVQIDFDALDDPSKRRLTYYASNILANISEMALLERAGDTNGVSRKLVQTRQLASRLETAATDFGLSRGELLNFFLTMLTTELRGPIPNAILTSDGQFRIAALFEPDDGSANVQAADNGYIDLLRNENIGGVNATN